MKEAIPVPGNSFDYVYSSHLIEDFEDTLQGLNEFIRILKPGGNLILVFPDQKKYEEVCKKTGQPLNQYHKHADMGLAYMKNALSRSNLKDFEILMESDREIDYNVVMVVKAFK
jgi:ubiquinone/menaquinone biosynthesis C-methylase UbiE